MDSTFSNQELQKIKTFGNFQSYSNGIFNPSFCGMMLWKISQGHILDEYKISQFQNIKCGIIIDQNLAYIFTPIENNDIKSHLKILLRNKTLKNGIGHAKASTMLVKYVQGQSSKPIIPCIKQIQIEINDMWGIKEELHIGDEQTYLTLLHRIYLLTFMLRYRILIQRKSPPGNWNLSTSRFCYKDKGWYSKLSLTEQRNLNNPTISISSDPIPEDSLHGVPISQLQNKSHISCYDIQNTTMFCDGSMNSLDFQKKVQLLHLQFIAWI